MNDAEHLSLEQLIATEAQALLRHVGARAGWDDIEDFRVAFAYAAFQILATMSMDEPKTERIWHEFLHEALAECIHNDIAARKTRDILRGIKEMSRK